MEYIIMAAIAVGLLVYILCSKHIENQSPESKSKEHSVDPGDCVYTSRWMFSYHEKDIYRKLCQIAQKYELTVFAKVRLLDLVEPVKGSSHYKAALYRVQSKHVDFVFTDKSLVARYVIELDDRSHDTPDRIKRDLFVDTVLKSCGYKVLHIRSIDVKSIEEFLSGV